ncbi:MAG: condensation domain-containing protein, partial [Acidobacteriota bacterium]
MSRTLDHPTDSAAPSRLSPEKRRLLELMLAERQAEKAARRRVARAEIETVDRSAPLHLSYAQQRLWFLDQLAPGNPAYNIPAAVRLTGALDGATLQRGLQVLMARHENLRTTFVAPDGEPSMHIHERVELPLERLDFSHLPHADALEAAQDRVPRITNRPFDLQAGPLVRVALMRLAENDHVLLVIMHHVISDVWSFGIFFQELGAVYDALVAGEEPSLPPLPFHYADYAAWQRRVLEGGEQARQLAFWKQQLDGAPLVLDLPTDRPRPARQRFFGGRVPLVIGGGVHDAVRELARAEDATPYMANLAILAIFLRRLTGQDDLLIGTPVTNRNRTELEAQIGFYVNSLAIRVDLSGEPTFRQLLRRVRDRCLPAFEHRDLPFERLVQELEVERDMSRNPIYQVDFAFQNFPKPYLRTPGLTLSPFETREAAARVDLEFDLKESHDGFEGFIRFNSDLFDPSTVERFAARFEKLLRAVLADPDRPIDRLALFTVEELAAIETFSDTERTFDEGELPIHRLVQRQVGKGLDRRQLLDGEQRQPVDRPIGIRQ